MDAGTTRAVEGTLLAPGNGVLPGRSGAWSKALGSARTPSRLPKNFSDLSMEFS
jgi:hypothetical protein